MKKRVKLIFPESLIKEPLTGQMAKNFDILPNILKAKVNEREGELILELEAKEEENLQKGLEFLKEKGVKVYQME